MELTNIKVTVIIPVFNSESYLQEALDSALGQSLDHLQVICVDDGSTDSSSHILARAASADPRLKIISNTGNHGPSVARNRGLRWAAGEYIFFLDSDDRLEDGVLEKAYQQAAADSLDMLLFNARPLFDSKQLAGQYTSYTSGLMRPPLYEQIRSGEELYIAMSEAGDYRCMLWMNLFRRRFIEESCLNFYPGIVFEDNLFTLSALLEANKARHTDLCAYSYRIRPGSCTYSPASLLKLASSRVVEEQLRLLASASGRNAKARSFIIREADQHMRQRGQLQQEWDERMSMAGLAGNNQSKQYLTRTAAGKPLQLRSFDPARWDGRPVVLCGTLDRVARAADSLMDQGLGASALICDEEHAGGVYHGLPVIGLDQLAGQRHNNLLLGSKVFYRRYMRHLPGMSLGEWQHINLLLESPDERRACETSLDRFFSRREEYFILPGLELVMTQRCTLRCRHCANRMQFYTEPCDYDEEDYLPALDRLLKAVDGLACLRIIGGEPLLLPEGIDRILETFGDCEQIWRIEIPTNGSLLFTASTLDRLASCPKAGVLISDYGPFSRRLEELTAQLQDYGIYHLVYPRDMPWYDYGQLRPYQRPEESVMSLFEKCESRRNCLSLLGRELYLCPLAAHGTALSAWPRLESEYLDLEPDLDVEPEQAGSRLRSQLWGLYTRQHPLSACTCCLGGRRPVPRGQQISHPLPYVRTTERGPMI